MTVVSSRGTISAYLLHIRNKYMYKKSYWWVISMLYLGERFHGWRWRPPPLVQQLSSRPKGVLADGSSAGYGTETVRHLPGTSSLFAGFATSKLVLCFKIQLLESMFVGYRWSTESWNKKRMRWKRCYWTARTSSRGARMAMQCSWESTWTNCRRGCMRLGAKRKRGRWEREMLCFDSGRCFNGIF